MIIVVECGLIDAGWPPHPQHHGEEDVSAFAEGLRAAWLPTRSYCDAGASSGGP